MKKDRVFPRLHLAINGKFLEQTSGRSGVYRVAYEMTMAIDKLLTTDNQFSKSVSCCIIAPEKKELGITLQSVQFEWSGKIGSFLNRKIWEQFSLPLLAKGRTLLNFCNLGPVLYGNAYTMIHDAQVNASPESYSKAFRLWYKFIQPKLAKKNRAVLTVSEHSRDQLYRYGVVTSSEIHVFHNGCDHVLRVRADQTAIERFGLKQGGFVVALSNTQKHKNIKILFDAFKSEELSGITLALFGAASRKDFEDLGHFIPSNVKFLGRVTDEELSGLLHGAIALGFPSLTEGFGLPPLEAMLLGCPVVAAPCGALVEVCGDKVAWAEPHSVRDWVREISHLHKNPEQALLISASARLHAANFTWENAARQLLIFLLDEHKKNFIKKDLFLAEEVVRTSVV